MSAPTMNSTSVLTEHLQYPAISLVDDIINAVNEIMYRCTAAMEKYLLERSVVDGEDYTEEVRVGIAKLETLLESSVDKNFDKLELYVLRNVLRIPQELLDANVFRLAHQRDFEVINDSQWEASGRDLQEKIRQIESAFNLHQQLTKQICATRALHNDVLKFKKSLVKVLECRDSSLRPVFDSLKPVDDSLRLITTQLRQLYVESEEYGSQERIDSITSRAQSNRTSLKSRSHYIDTRARAILNNSTTTYESRPSKIEIQDPDLSQLDIT